MRRVHSIEAQVLEMVNASARDLDPLEFLCLLRAEDGVVVELVLLPGTISGDGHGIINLWMAPVDFSICGSVHSHPGPSNLPSEEDLSFFGRWGGLHIITCRPYDMGSWRAYDSRGRERHLEVIR